MSTQQIEANRRNAAAAPIPVVEPLGPPSLNHTPQITSPQIGFVLSSPSPDQLQPTQSPQQCDISHISGLRQGDKQ
jgi:hypothetical protein